MSSTPESRQLIEGLRHNNRAAQENFLRQKAPVVFRFISRMTRNEQDAEELTQDTLLRAMRHIDSYDDKQASLTSWICRIAYRLTLNHLRSRRCEEVSFDENISLISSINETTIQQALSDTSQAMTDLVLQAIEQLTTDEQTLVTLFYYDDRPLNEIAFIMEAPPGTLATRLHRIRKKLSIIIKRLQPQ